MYIVYSVQYSAVYTSICQILSRRFLRKLGCGGPLVINLHSDGATNLSLVLYMTSLVQHFLNRLIKMKGCTCYCKRSRQLIRKTPHVNVCIKV